ncbi:heavy metal-associated domain-containing protein [Cytobacillus praedii]|uniref:heavy-metal-associated domain-containing protein n=1 Tax=Cytobacillus praedii TaxID=1742358 RepID=UPI002E1BAC7E|nr:heavy metal-associated domain-containing protein [Cytobacillus praedii]
MTLFIKEVTSEQPIQILETILIQMDGVERALVDTEDGEVKVTYNDDQITQEQIIARIRHHGLHPIG